jgi:hypothetical protein
MASYALRLQESKCRLVLYIRFLFSLKLPKDPGTIWPFKSSSHIAHLRQQSHKSKFMIFQEKRLKILKYYNFLWVQRRHNCSPAASFANCVMAPYLLKVHLKTFPSITITQKCQTLSCGILVANEQNLNKTLVLIPSMSQDKCTSSWSWSSPSSSYVCHGVRPLVDPFRSHVSRSLFKCLQRFLLPVGE